MTSDPLVYDKSEFSFKWIECVLSNESEIYEDILVAWKVIIIWAKGGKQNIKYSV